MRHRIRERMLRRAQMRMDRHVDRHLDRHLDGRFAHRHPGQHPGWHGEPWPGHGQPHWPPHWHLYWHLHLRQRFRHSLGAKLLLVFLAMALLVGLGVHRAEHHQASWAWLVVGVPLVTALAYIAIRHTLRPLRALAAGAAAFGRGDLKHRIRVHHRDEIATLADHFNQMAQDIEAMLDAKRELLLAISHELRSPLTRARLNAELLDERGPSHQGLVHELGQMCDLIEDLLERERLDAGHTALKLQDCTPAALIEDLVQRRFAEARAQRQLVLSLSDTLPAQAHLDKTRVQLMLGNLLENALRHNDAGQGAVELSASMAGPDLLLLVRDHGPGVPEEALAQLGQPFFRPETARTREGGGVGLGLNLCMLVAQAHGGSLVLRNAQPSFEALATLPISLPI